MFMPVDAQIDLSNRGEQVAVEARVLSEQPRPLTWHMTVATTTGGGINRVVQSGRTDGASRQPLAVVVVNRASHGDVALRVEDAGQVVAERTVTLGAATP